GRGCRGRAGRRSGSSAAGPERLGSLDEPRPAGRDVATILALDFGGCKSVRVDALANLGVERVARSASAGILSSSFHGPVARRSGEGQGGGTAGSAGASGRGGRGVSGERGSQAGRRGS